jgi:hypothetical protein
MNAEAASETRMVKSYLDIFCENTSPKAKGIGDSMVVLKHDKIWIAPKDPDTGLPKPLKDGSVPHPFTGFYFMYPDEERNPRQRGLVSTISNDPPMLNWIYVDTETLELKYGNKTQSIAHIVGPWDWTEDETGITLEDWEGFSVVEEKEMPDGLKWAVYYDQWDDDFGNGRKVDSRTRFQCSLERRILPEELTKAQEEEANKKMQVNSSGNIKSKWG